jgi:hypothetical protein
MREIMKENSAINNIRNIFETEGSYEKIIKDYKDKHWKKFLSPPIILYRLKLMQHLI